MARASFGTLASSKRQPKVFASRFPDRRTPGEVGVHVPGGTVWLSQSEAAALAADLAETVETLRREETDRG